MSETPQQTADRIALQRRCQACGIDPRDLGEQERAEAARWLQARRRKLGRGLRQYTRENRPVVRGV